MYQLKSSLVSPRDMQAAFGKLRVHKELNPDLLDMRQGWRPSGHVHPRLRKGHEGIL